ncbi:hypothetical protein SANA_05880 [Gottschalkiaceae bacterium SANA]|nr:hypothetical protein SANA_05880 [Gottschalkiaceae bacterium SANA]
MKKIGLLLLVGFMVFGSMAFAAEGSTPADIYANLTGKTTEEAWGMRGQGRFGELAAEEGVSEAFIAQMLLAKKAAIQAMVGDGLTQEEADEAIAALEAQVADCDGTQQQAQLLQGLGMRFGNGQGAGLGNANGQGAGFGNAKGQGNANGRGGNGGNRRGTQDATGARAQDGTCLLPQA